MLSDAEATVLALSGLFVGSQARSEDLARFHATLRVCRVHGTVTAATQPTDFEGAGVVAVRRLDEGMPLTSRACIRADDASRAQGLLDFPVGTLGFEGGHGIPRSVAGISLAPLIPLGVTFSPPLSILAVLRSADLGVFVGHEGILHCGRASYQRTCADLRGIE